MPDLRLLPMDALPTTSSDKCHAFIPSIRDDKYAFWGSVDDKDFYFSGPQQTRAADFAKDLRNVKLKEAIVKFFQLMIGLIRW
ncbi:hypothetical protein EVAR_3238_1 [Eumeta japonica]|uniref:Uncharacterized protein n=1 Tax=Eumeta variegata TaxID=151549 RepID=A0A4C1SY81_EUMVA|nr:hypothetical protein EVAR_3238_1 [Eumeta japonica]